MIDKLQVVADMLREHGFDEEARWIEHRDAVRVVFANFTTSDGGYCVSCGETTGYSHLRTCKLAQSLRDLKHPAIEEDADSAHYEALDEERRRNDFNVPTRRNDLRPMTMTGLQVLLRNTYPPERLDAALYADNPRLSLLPRKK